MFKLRENGAPSGLEGTLKMDRLDAQQRQRTTPGEQARRARTRGEVKVFFQGAAQPVLFLGIHFGESDEIPVKHIVGLGAQDVSKPAGHAGTKVQAKRPEDDSHASSHILATVLADTFDNGKRTAVADSETLPGAAGEKKLARGRAVEHGVAGKNVAAPGSSRPGGDCYGSAGQSFSNVVVSFALELEGYALGKKGSKALARRAMKILPDLFIAGKAVLAPAHQFPAEARANTAIRVLNRLRLILETERGMEMKRFFKRPDVESRLLLRGCASRLRTSPASERK